MAPMVHMDKAVQAVLSRRAVATSAGAASSASGNMGTNLANPLTKATNVSLLRTTDGAKVPVSELVRGKTVLALLRHLG